MSRRRPVLRMGIILLPVLMSVQTEAAFRDGFRDASVSASEVFERAEGLRREGDLWAACRDYSLAWQLARASEPVQAEIAVRTAAPYCRLLFEFDFRDPLWWVADEALTLSRQIEGPSPETERSIGWVNYWNIMRGRVLDDRDAAEGCAAEALRIAGEVDDGTLGAWTRLERSRVRILPDDAVEAEVEILRCKAEPLYETDPNYRAQCDLRMLDIHLAHGRFEQAARVAEGVVRGDTASLSHRAEALFILGEGYRQADELLRATACFCLGKWLYPEQSGWKIQCEIGLRKILTGRSEAEQFGLFEMACGLGTPDAACGIDLEILERIQDKDLQAVAADRIASVTPEGVSTPMWHSVILYRPGGMCEPGVLETTVPLMLVAARGEYAKTCRIVGWPLLCLSGADGIARYASFLEAARPMVPEALYFSRRMSVSQRGCDHASAVEAAWRQLDATRDPELFRRYPDALRLVPGQQTQTYLYLIQRAVDNKNDDGLEEVLQDLVREAPDPAYIQDKLNWIASSYTFYEQPEIMLKILDVALEYDFSPVKRNRSLCLKGEILIRLGRRDEAEAAYRQVIARPDFMEDGHSWVRIAYEGLGRILEGSGRKEEAPATYRQLIALRENVGEGVIGGYQSLAKLYLSMGRLDDADEVAVAGLDWLRDRHPWGIYMLDFVRADVFAARGNMEAAVEIYRGYTAEGYPEYTRSLAREWLRTNEADAE